MEKLQATVKDIIEQETIKNLLSAQKQIAENGGSDADLIRVTKYLLRLAKKFGNVLAGCIVNEEEKQMERTVVASMKREYFEIGIAVMQALSNAMWTKEKCRIIVEYDPAQDVMKVYKEVRKGCPMKS